MPQCLLPCMARVPAVLVVYFLRRHLGAAPTAQLQHCFDALGPTLYAPDYILLTGGLGRPANACYRCDGHKPGALPRCGRQQWPILAVGNTVATPRCAVGATVLPIRASAAAHLGLRAHVLCRMLAAGQPACSGAPHEYSNLATSSAQAIAGFFIST